MKAKAIFLLAALLQTASMLLLNVSLAQVTEEWVSRYNGPGNYWDIASSIAVDDSGNVYVTGGSDGIGTNTDYATIKYNSSGDTLWVQRYNGVNVNSYDFANSLAIDGSGNVYVTGRSDDSYVTIKYNSSGDQQWIAISDSIGTANSLAIDSSGNVYVTGSSYNYIGSATGNDYVTIKYNSSGVQQWVMGYNGTGNGADQPSSLVIDGSGNVYVTGQSTGNGTLQDFATLKYDSAGVQQWVERYNGPGNGYEYYPSLAIDDSGNVYVTGYNNNYEYVTLKYNSSGVQQWVDLYYGGVANSIVVDDSGYVYVVGIDAAGWDYTTIKYNSAGDTLWVSKYNGPGNGQDEALSLAVDSSGNVYVTGYCGGIGTDRDYTTIKYNSSGVQQWVMDYNGPGNGWDVASKVAVDGSGNVYVTGVSPGSGTEKDYATIKYSQTMVGIPPGSNEIPDVFQLNLFPNPFSGSTSISFFLTQSQNVSLKIYDVNGRLISTLADKKFDAGENEIIWNATDVNAGIYFLRMLACPAGRESDSYSEYLKLIVAK